MDLHADVEDGLDSTFNTDEHIDLITPPAVKAGGGNEVTVVTPLNGNIPQEPFTEEQLFGDHLEEGKLPDFDAQFAILDKNRVRIIDMKDVEETIVNKDNISQEDARLIDGVFGNFFSARLNVKEFTQTPTKTNLQRARNFMRNSIATEECQLMSQMADFFAKPMQDLETFRDHVKDSFVPAAKDQVLTFTRQYEDVLKNVLESKNTVLPVGQNFINIVTVPIHAIAMEDLGELSKGFTDEYKIPAVDAFKLAVTSLQALLKGRMSHFLESALAGNPDIDLGHEQGFPDSKLTIGDLVKLYQGTNLISGLDFIEQTVNQSLESFRSIMEEVHSNESQDFDKINELVLTKTPDILKACKHISHAYNLSRNITLVNLAVQSVFNFLKFCL